MSNFYFRLVYYALVLVGLVALLEFYWRVEIRFRWWWRRRTMRKAYRVIAE